MTVPRKIRRHPIWNTLILIWVDQLVLNYLNSIQRGLLQFQLTIVQGRPPVPAGWIPVTTWPVARVWHMCILLYIGRQAEAVIYCAGIFKQSMVVRNREGIGLLYRPATLHRLVVLIPWNRFHEIEKFKNLGLVHPHMLHTCYRSHGSWRPASGNRANAPKIL
jgi:hypothetical protein